jgi:hypothetical protein
VSVDYGSKRQQARSKIPQAFAPTHNLVGCREVTKQLRAGNWWPLATVPNHADDNQHLRESILQEQTFSPFAIWFVFEPKERTKCRFSLLYICQEAVAAFERLYLKNDCTPEFLAIIKPGHAMGGNWTDFTDEQTILGQLVLTNAFGTPRWLLCYDNVNPLKAGRWGWYNLKVRDERRADHVLLEVWAHTDEKPVDQRLEDMPLEQKRRFALALMSGKPKGTSLDISQVLVRSDRALSFTPQFSGV